MKDISNIGGIFNENQSIFGPQKKSWRSLEKLFLFSEMDLK